MSDWEKMREIAKDLKGLAIKHNIMIVTAQQLPRERPSTGVRVHRGPDVVIFDYCDLLRSARR